MIPLGGFLDHPHRCSALIVVFDICAFLILDSLHMIISIFSDMNYVLQVFCHIHVTSTLCHKAIQLLDYYKV